jgi:hypothetical protein
MWQNWSYGHGTGEPWEISEHRRDMICGFESSFCLLRRSGSRKRMVRVPPERVVLGIQKEGTAGPSLEGLVAVYRQGQSCRHQTGV